jgi:putative transposase
MKRMEEYAYYWGITLRIYPDTKAKQIIFNNGGCSRFIYNRLVAIQQEIYNLKKVDIYIDTVAERLEYLQSIYCNAAGLKNPGRL